MNQPPIENNNQDTIRLNKYLALCGIASRRGSAPIIQSGLVLVNDTVIKDIGYRVNKKDVIKYKGKVITPVTKKIYILLNKPKNTITTLSDERNRPTVMDLIKDVKERIYPVGRLDRMTTGLLVLTNDGDLAKKLTHPSHRVSKVYHVILDKDVTPLHIEMIRNGLNLEDGHAMVDGVDYSKNKPKNEIGIELHIGKNRIVRRIFEHLGYKVIKLDRVYYAGLTKKNLTRGWHRHLTEKEVIMLKHFTGK